MFRFLRPKLKTPNAVYGLGPLVNSWGAARLIYEKLYAYPLQSEFGRPNYPIFFQYNIVQPPPALAVQGAVKSGLPGIPTGGWYVLPITSPDFTG